MRKGGDIPGGTANDDDWFADARAGSRRTSPDDWIGGAPPAREPRRGLGPSAPVRLSRRGKIITLVALVALVAAGVVLAIVFTGGNTHPTTPPVTLPTTTTPVTTTTPKPPAGTATASPTVTLKPGDTGTQVKRLQRVLRLFGYSTSPVDGVYGPATTGAVKRFQQASHLDADGIVGPATLRALKAAVRSRS
jgi:Putative peptidoglycan binding domain